MDGRGGSARARGHVHAVHAPLEDERAYALATPIAGATGHCLTQVVLGALEQYGKQFEQRTMDRRGIREILERVHARPVLAPRTPDEILGW